MATAAAIILKFILIILHHLGRTWISRVLRQVKQPQAFARSAATNAPHTRCADAINAISDYAEFIRVRTILIQLRFRARTPRRRSAALALHGIDGAAA